MAMVGVAVANGPPDDSNAPTGASIWAPERSRHIEIADGPDDAERVATLWFGNHSRGHTLVFVHGGSLEMNGVLRWFAGRWVELGYTLRPLVSGHTVRAIIVKKGRYRWVLCDLEAMTGADAPTAIEEAYARLPAARQHAPIFEAVWEWLSDLQVHTMREYGVYLRPTVGGTAIRVAGFALPEGELIPRPLPAVVALCRIGMGYRGGYVYGRRYQGPAVKVDCRRMYAHALRDPLPTRWALGRGIPGLHQTPGIYVCTVSGTPYHPVTLGAWDGPERGFIRRFHDGGETICILPSSELPGLRAMGLRVTVGWGYMARDTVEFSPLVERFGRVLSEHGPDSAIGRLTKLLGNAIYGKMAARPTMQGIEYSASRPSDDAFPMVTLDGDDLENLWRVETTQYNTYQQVGMAAMITGAARSHLYLEMARQIRDGRTIVHAHTDGFIMTGEAPDDLPWETDAIGAWRIVATDERATVVRGGGYVLNDDPKWSGVPGWTRRQIEIAWERGEWVVQGLRVASR